MKFKKDGKVFDDIMKARRYHCDITEDCDKCFPKGASCSEECRNNPRKSAQLMGFEVIEDEDDKTELLVDIGSMTLAQAKEYCTKRNANAGDSYCSDGCELNKHGLCDKYIYQWNLARPRLTPEELEICMVLGAKWISRQKVFAEEVVSLWEEMPSANVKEDGIVIFGPFPVRRIATVNSDKFPSVKPGDCISVEDLL